MKAGVFLVTLTGDGVGLVFLDLAGVWVASLVTGVLGIFPAAGVFFLYDLGIVGVFLDAVAGVLLVPDIGGVFFGVFAGVLVVSDIGGVLSCDLDVFLQPSGVLVSSMAAGVLGVFFEVGFVFLHVLDVWVFLKGFVGVLVGSGGVVVFFSVSGVLMVFLEAGVIHTGGVVLVGRYGDLVVFMEGLAIFCFLIGGVVGDLCSLLHPGSYVLEFLSSSGLV